MHSDTLLKRITAYTGNEPGTGALTTWIESGWHLSMIVPAQPHFPQQDENTFTLWGYGFEIDNEGDYVPKKMSQATGTEILTELIHRLGFEDILDEVLGDIVFTVEYSIHGAMHAVYEFFGVDRPIPPIYQGLRDRKVGLKALQSAFQ